MGTVKASWEVVEGSLDEFVIVSRDPVNLEGGVDAPGLPPKNILAATLEPPLKRVPLSLQVEFPSPMVVRSVFLRSSSRVYEVYLHPLGSNDPEYVCTVKTIPVPDTPPSRQLTARPLMTQHAESAAAGEVAGGEACGKRSSEGESGVLVPFMGTEPVATSARQMSQPCLEGGLQLAPSASKPCSSVTIKLLSLPNKSSFQFSTLHVHATPSPVLDPQALPPPPPSTAALGHSLPSLMQAFMPQMGLGGGLGGGALELAKLMGGSGLGTAALLRGLGSANGIAPPGVLGGKLLPPGMLPGGGLLGAAAAAPGPADVSGKVPTRSKRIKRSGVQIS